MKRVKIFAIAVIALVSSLGVKAQEFSASADIVSSYVWRGVQYAGVSVQPTLDFTTGGFSIGSWGCAGFDGYMEMDLYATYAFNFGLSVGLTDYYYPGSDYFDYSKATGAHGYELNLGYSISNFSVSANYMLNEAGSAGTAGGDKYFELGYDFGKFNIFAGAGDGWHTSDGNFGVVNVGIGTSKEIKITDSFSLPVTATAILNPTAKQYYLVAGISL